MAALPGRGPFQRLLDFLHRRKSIVNVVASALESWDQLQLAPEELDVEDLVVNAKDSGSVSLQLVGLGSDRQADVFGPNTLIVFICAKHFLFLALL